MNAAETEKAIRKEIATHIAEAIANVRFPEDIIREPSHNEMLEQHYLHGTPHPDDQYLPIYCWEDE